MEGSWLTLRSREDLDFEYQDLFLEQHSKTPQLIQALIGQLDQDSSIDCYLRKVELSSEVLKGELQLILDKHPRVVEVYRESPIIGTVYRVYEYINSWLESIDLSRKDPKQKAVWILEVQARLGCVYEHFLFALREEVNITNSPKMNYHHVWDRITVISIRDPPGLKKVLAFRQ